MKCSGALALCVIPYLTCLLATPLVAQTTIGGGTCSSATLSGTYAVSMTGRQVTSAGKFTNVMQANGSVTFDGQSKVAFAMTQSTLQTTGTPLNWTGTYSVQANCASQMTISSGGSATFNLAIYSGGADILFTGSDSTYSYSGNADNQPASGCSTAALSGVYVYSGTGYFLTSGSVSAPLAVTGLLQFDGQGNLTTNLTITTGGNSTVQKTAGTYSLSSNCLASATASAASGTLMGSLSVYALTSGSPSDAYLEIAINGNFMASGSMHLVYGQPSSTAMLIEQKRNQGAVEETKL